MFEYYYYHNYDHARTTSVTTATWTASSCCTRSPIASRTTTSPTCWLVYSAVTATRRPPSYLPPTRPTSCASDRSPTEVREPNYYRPHRSIGCGLLLYVQRGPSVRLYYPSDLKTALFQSLYSSPGGSVAEWLAFP